MRLLLLLCACLSANVTFAQHGTGPDWAAPAPLPLAHAGAGQRGALYNNMVVTSTGRIVVVTQEYDAATNALLGAYLTTSDDEGQTWSAPQLVEPMAMLIGGADPKLALDSEDHIYLLFSARQPAGLYCSKYDSDLNLLIDTVQVAPAFQFTSWYPHLTVDGQDRLHAIWHEGNHKQGEQTECYYARSLDGGLSWSTPVMLSTDDGRHSAFPRAQFDAAHGDQLAIVWRDSVGPQNWDIRMVTSTDGGASWSAPQVVVQSPHNDSDPDLVIDPEGRWHLFFHRYPVGNAFNGAAVWYGFSDDGGQNWMPDGWRKLSDEGVRSHLLEGNRYDEWHDRLWAVWKDERDAPGGGPDIALSYSNDGGLTWSAPEFATDEGDWAVGYKSMYLMPDGRPALNYELHDPTGGTPNRVYFRLRALDPATSTYAAPAPANWSAWPNPTSGRVQLALPDGLPRRLRLYTPEGRLLHEADLSGAAPAINLSAWPAGLYLLEVEGLGVQRIVRLR